MGISVTAGSTPSGVDLDIGVPLSNGGTNPNFQLTGGGSGVIESAGIDYILPYWMSRFNNVTAAFVVQSAAAGIP